MLAPAHDETMTSADRMAAVSAAAAHDLNDDLSIVLSTAELALREIPREHPARPLLLELQGAALRCAWKTSVLLNFGALKGARATSTTLEGTISGVLDRSV